MKSIFILVVLALFAGVLACAFLSNAGIAADAALQLKSNEETSESFDTGNRQPVLVELFTSEGCSSCPPADKVLIALEKEQPVAQAEIIALSLHVDYWDSASWKDNYSQIAFSKRQDIYSQSLRQDSNYTPEMIVDGQTGFVGSDAGRAQKAISEALKMPKAKIELVQTQDKLKIKITDVPAHENATIFLAVAEDNLAPSNVRGGENSGRKLTHASVVRELKSLAMLAADRKNLDTEATFQLQPDWKKENLKLVVFLQENQTRKVFGVNKVLLDK